MMALPFDVDLTVHVHNCISGNEIARHKVNY